MKLKFKAFAAFMLAAVVSLALFLSPSEAAKARQLRYYALDVGQGDCSLFVLPDGRARTRKRPSTTSNRAACAKSTCSSRRIRTRTTSAE